MSRRAGDGNISAPPGTPRKPKRSSSPERRSAEKRTPGDGSISTPSKKQKRHSSPERRVAAKKILKKIQSDLNEYEDVSACPTKKLIQYIMENISKLNKGAVKKKTTVGVFGETGAGKSSLINAILGEKDLLPSGTLCACTSVIIQVGANVTDSNYTAEIEFISKEEWEEELKTLREDVLEDNEDIDDDMSTTDREKITALYGEEGFNMSVEDLMKDDKFSAIPEFLRSETKKITCETASDLTSKIKHYVQHDDSSPGGFYWPVVKSVTINVPNCEDFLEHVLLVDLPGTGDYNKSRDQMWKSKLRECSTVWIVNDINRACSKKEAWRLVSNSVRDMAQGGECRSICFICTKTDQIDPDDYSSTEHEDEDSQITPEDSQYNDKRKCIFNMNKKAKEMVQKNFKQLPIFKKHFNCDDNFLSVFTVSSKEFTKKDPILTPEQTEIPMLKERLRKYNNNHTNEMTSQYISGALGILYLIQGFKENDTEMKENRTRLHETFQINLDSALKHLQEYSDHIYSRLEELLLKGAKESEEKCAATAKKLIAPKKDGRGFHRTLTALCKNDGFCRSKKTEIDLNTSLAEHMLQYINEEFCKIFPVMENATEKSLQENIDKFTIIPENEITTYENSPVLSHILKFLESEEMKLKTELKQEIVERKKRIYTSLSESIKTTMLPCYQSAAAKSGKGSMKVKQEILLRHIESSKSEMFQKAKKKMLEELRATLNYAVEEIKTGLTESMEYSLLNSSTLPDMDVSKEIKEMKELKRPSTQD